MSTLFAMKNRVQAYAWGSHSALASIRGEAGPTADPEAEMWMGAHPLAPSQLVTPHGERSLLDLAAEQPDTLLGASVRREFNSFPFLMKILAAREPLSLQAHPSAEQAKAGFAREEASGLSLGAPTRSYKDPHHKPELIAALTPFAALVGFRDPRKTSRLFAALDKPRLAPIARFLAEQPPKEALCTLFDTVLRAAPTAREDLARETLAACRTVRTVPEFLRELAWAARIGELYPGDPGIVLALALNLVILQPGEAVHLPAGNLHAYLEGTGIEIMASSDNVLRGGLTPKYVDVGELSRVLDFTPGPASLVPTELRGHERHYLTPTREFALSRFALAEATASVGPVKGPEIVVVTSGALDVRRNGDSLRLPSGTSAFITAEGGDYTLSGTGTAFRARVNDG
ncbi:MAG TPA: mannose-6-phosphate isomerase, class I [Polyangiaceae bacterium]|nr:mannose-6-phosphate isomerase, class I [Polyangiaceae bacterium]